MVRRKSIFFWFLPVFLGGFFCLGAQGLSVAAEVKFSLSLDKAEYSGADPINATLILKNIGSKPVIVNQRFYISSENAAKNQKDVYFELLSPAGQRLICQHFYETGYPKTEAFKVLAPGEEIKSEYPRNLRGFFEINEPGVYTLKAVYQNVFGSEIGLVVFKEQLVSDPVKFTVVNSKK